MSKSTRHPPWRARNAVELGAVLARIRRERGETQAEVARQIGAHTPYLSNLENGHSVEQMTRVFSLLRHYGYVLHVVRIEDDDAD